MPRDGRTARGDVETIGGWSCASIWRRTRAWSRCGRFWRSLGADGSEPLLPEREEQYGHIQRSLVRFRYRTLRRAERGLVLEYLQRTTGLSRSQVTKLVGRSQREAQLRDRRRPGRPFASKYTRADIAALAELDGEHGRLSGPAYAQAAPGGAPGLRAGGHGTPGRPRRGQRGSTTSTWWTR